MLKPVASGEVRLRGLAPGQPTSEETSLLCRAVGDTVSDLTDPRIELITSRPVGNVFNDSTNRLV